MSTEVTAEDVAGTAGNKDFTRLWFGRAVSDLGSAISMIALPLVTVVVLQASTFQVSLLAALSSLVGGLLAIPLGTIIEYRPKRPTMIAADLLRAIGLVSVPVAATLGGLTFTQVCVVAVLNAAFAVAFGAASQAHLKSLVGPSALANANGRLESTLWFGTSIGPALAGVLIGLFGAAWALVVDALSFVISAFAVRRIRRPEPSPLARTAVSRRADLVAGWHFLLGQPTLRRCLISYAVFSGTVMLLAPLETLFLLRTLLVQPWQYGVVLGLPCLAGLLGARTAPVLIRRLGVERAMWCAGWSRGPWMALFPLATPGPWGIVLCGVAFAGLLGFSALHNTALTTYRQMETPDPLIARATTAWSITVRGVQPLFVLAGGLFAAHFGIRAGLWLGAGVLLLSALPLPAHRSSSLPTQRASSNST